MVDRIADTRETWVHEWTYPQLRHRKAIKLFSTITGNNLLDVGCGNGHLTKLLAEAAHITKVVGVDVLEGEIEERSIEILNVDVDKEPLPFGDDSFDVIHCGETIEHVYSTDKLLSEIWRVLKPKGTCVITTPNLASWPNRIALVLGFQPYSTSVSISHEVVGKLGLRSGFHGQWGHIRCFTLRALVELLRLHNFEVVKVEGWEIGTLDIHIGRGIGLVKLVDKVISRIPSLAPRIVVVISKR